MRKEALYDIVLALKEGTRPTFDPRDFPCLGPENLAGKEHVGQAQIEALVESLSEADIPTFERAIKAMDDGELGWIGFKLVFDPTAAVANTDNEVTKKYGDTGSASGDPMVFFCSDAKEVAASQPYSPRDLSPRATCSR